MTDDEVLARSAHNMAEMWVHVAGSSKGRVARWADAIAAYSAAPNPVPNRTTLTSPASDDGMGIVRRASDFYGEAVWGLVDPWSTIDLSSRGFRVLAPMPAMVLDPRAPGFEAPKTDLSIRRVEDDETLRAFRRALFSSFDLVPWPAESHPLLGPPFYKDPSFIAWVGFDGDDPVATSVARIGEGIVGVYWVSTHPSRRGRGFGEAISWAATQADPSLAAVLQASGPGFPVYERMGYRRIGTATFWVPTEREA